MKWLWREGEGAEIPFDSAAQWRAALQRETARLRAIRPIPTLESLPELQRQQAEVIARGISHWADDAEMKRGERSVIFVSTLEGLAALERVFPSGHPDGIFPISRNEVRQWNEAHIPAKPSRSFGHFDFGSEFRALDARSEDPYDVTPEKRVALRQWGERKNRQIFLHSWYFRAAPLMGQGHTDVYSWDGSDLKVLQTSVAWIS